MNSPRPAGAVAEWANDARSQITIADLLRMSSGLSFNNFGLGNENSLSTENHHFRIYFDGINVFDHAVSFPAAVEPNTRWRYLNSDRSRSAGSSDRRSRREGRTTTPSVDRSVRPDRIKNAVLETDAWGNFILTAYDYMSARDWARFGLLHLQDGVWDGERSCPRAGSTSSAPLRRRVRLETTVVSSGSTQVGVRPDPRDAFWPAGFMGQNTVVIPSSDLVIVRLGPSPGDEYAEYMNEFVAVS